MALGLSDMSSAVREVVNRSGHSVVIAVPAQM